MKIYLSGPMSGVPNYNAPMFDAATKKLREEGFEVLSPVELDRAEGFDLESPPKASYWSLLARDVFTIGDSELSAIFVLPGWEKSKGARLEVFQALLMKLPVVSYETRKRYQPVEIMWKLQRSLTEAK